MRVDSPCYMVFSGMVGPTAQSLAVRELTILIDSLPCTLGRAPNAPLTPTGKHFLIDDGDTTLSREHASISWNAPLGCFEISCLSKNGIVVNNARVKKGETAVIRSNSALRMGAARLYVSLPIDFVEGPEEEKTPKKRKPVASGDQDSESWIDGGQVKKLRLDNQPLTSAEKEKNNESDSKYFQMLAQAFASGDISAEGCTQAQICTWISENLGVEMSATVKKGIYFQMNRKCQRIEPVITSSGKKGPLLWTLKL
jgi:hypothetical protein